MSPETQKSNTVAIVVAVIGVIGTVVASVIGASATINAEKIRQESAMTQIALVAIATQGGATQVAMASTISAPINNMPTDIPVTPTVGNSNPVGIVQSNAPISVDGLTLIFRGISVDNQNNISLALSIKNIGDRNRVFRYTGFSITLRDDIGNAYSPYTGERYGQPCGQTGLYDTKQINIDIGQEVKLYSINAGSNNSGGCIEDFDGKSFQQFIGPMAQAAKSFFIGFHDFGSFTGFEMEVKP